MKKELIVFLFVLAAIAQSTLWTVSELPAPAYNWRGAMKMSPDKKYLASYNYNRVLLYDIVTQNEIIVHTFRMSYDRNPTLSWSYDSRSIMFPDLVNEQNEPDSSAVIQYSIETGLKDTILTNNGYHAYFSPVDNKILYNMGIGFDPESLYVWNLYTGEKKLITIGTGTYSPFESFGWAKNSSRYVWTVCHDGDITNTIKVIDIDTDSVMCISDSMSNDPSTNPFVSVAVFEQDSNFVVFYPHDEHDCTLYYYNSYNGETKVYSLITEWNQNILIGCNPESLDSGKTVFVQSRNMGWVPFCYTMLKIDTQNDIIDTMYNNLFGIDIWSQWSTGYHQLISNSEFYMIVAFDYETDYKLQHATLGVGIEEENTIGTSRIHSIYPNPFNNSTTIKYQVTDNEKLKINVFNSNGELVEKLYEGEPETGLNSINFNALKLNSGVFFVQISGTTFNETKKMILLR